MPLLRVYLDVAALTSAAYTAVLEALPPETQEKIKRYHFPADRYLSLGSALLQRWVVCSHYVAHTTLASVPLHIDPSSGRPSHAAAGAFRGGLGVEDYNTTHHKSSPGERCIVALCARTSALPSPERQRRVGVDVVPTAHRNSAGAADFVETFCGENGAGVFTALEISTIMAHRSLRKRVQCLYLFWVLKEAYTKAIGTGVVMDLMRIEFREVGIFEGARWRGAAIWVDGVDRSAEWYLEVSFVRGILGEEEDGFYLAVCCQREGLTEEDMEGDWREMDMERDVVKPWGGQH